MRSEKKERQQKGAAQREGEGDSFPGAVVQRQVAEREQANHRQRQNKLESERGPD